MFKLLLAMAFVSCGTAFASGYERALTFGGRSAGIGGVATPYIQGPQSLYFNPAGLVSDKEGHAVDVDLSLVQSQFKGPIDNTNAPIESEKKLVTPFGAFYGITTDPKMGFGFGVYSSAGSKATFNDLKIGNVSGNKIESDLQILEASLGAAYRIMPNFKVGVAYRVLMTSGSFSFAQRNGANAVANAEVNDLKGTNAMGYRIGMQYDLSENTRFGLTYRGQSDLVLKGKFGGSVKTPAPASAGFMIQENDATVKTVLPQAVNVGVQQKMGAYNLFGEYVWTQYGKIEHVTIDGNLRTNNGLVNQANAADLEQHWKDQHQIKIGGEYVGMMMPIRLGYIWTSQVTDDDFARASFIAPANGNSFTLGTGYAFNEKMSLDGALDYTLLKGEGNGAAAGSTAGDFRQGEHTTTAIALHLGFSYAF